MNIVIINKDQSDTISEMKKSLEDSGVYNPLKTIWVLDRCTDNSEETALKEDVVYIKNNFGENRQTSRCRNLGYEFVNGLDYDDTLFLDADRYPITKNLGVLEDSPFDITLLKLEEDPRDMLGDFNNYYGTVYNNFFSCGLFIRKEAAAVIENFYKEHQEDYGESIIFPENLQQFWGVEDTHLGDICYHLGLSCGINENIRLRGNFDKLKLDNINILIERFKYRNKLNVIW